MSLDSTARISPVESMAQTLTLPVPTSTPRKRSDPVIFRSTYYAKKQKNNRLPPCPPESRKPRGVQSVQVGYRICYGLGFRECSSQPAARGCRVNICNSQNPRCRHLLRRDCIDPKLLDNTRANSIRLHSCSPKHTWLNFSVRVSEQSKRYSLVREQRSTTGECGME